MQSNEHGHEQHGGAGLYLSVFFGLLVLTGISFATPRFFADLPGVMRTIMIAVSCCKAMLVILFFMHLKWEANWKYVLTFPALCMSIFLVLMLVPDIAWRLEKASRSRWLHSAVPEGIVPYEEGPPSATPAAEHGAEHGAEP